MPVNGWMDKNVVIYRHNEVSCSHEKGGLSFGHCDNMDGPWTVYADICQTETEKYCMISSICRITKVKLIKNSE